MIPDSVVTEMNSFIWTKPIPNDLGWNCRDHALVSGMIHKLLGNPVLICKGKQALVDYDNKITISQLDEVSHLFHYWLQVSEQLFDYSLNYSSVKQLKKYMKNKQPVVTYGFCSMKSLTVHNFGTLTDVSAKQFASYMRANLDGEKRVLLYGSIQRFGFTRDVITEGFQFTNSPLSHKLEGMGLKASVYLKLALHLLKRIYEPNSPDLTHKGFVFKWNYINENYDYDTDHLEKLDVQPERN